MSDAQEQEREETHAARAYRLDAQLTELRAKYRHLERDRNALLAELRELRAQPKDSSRA